MKRKLLAPLFTAVCLLAASQPLLAATKKADARNADLVAALQAVSADPLGGRLGLAVATAQAPAISPAKGERQVAVQEARKTSADQRAYAAWKGASKS